MVGASVLAPPFPLREAMMDAPAPSFPIILRHKGEIRLVAERYVAAFLLCALAQLPQL